MTYRHYWKRWKQFFFTAERFDNKIGFFLWLNENKHRGFGIDLILEKTCVLGIKSIYGYDGCRFITFSILCLEICVSIAYKRANE